MRAKQSHAKRLFMLYASVYKPVNPRQKLSCGVVGMDYHRHTIALSEQMNVPCATYRAQHIATFAVFARHKFRPAI